MRTVSILGVGRAGGAVAIALDRAGYRIDSLILRGQKELQRVLDALSSQPEILDAGELSGIDADILIIATGDSEIVHAVKTFAGIDTLPDTVLHLSGSLSSAILKPLRVRGVSTGSMHPLVALSDPISGADAFAGSYFCIEGDASDIAEEIAAKLGGRTITIATEKKALYHAAAVTSSGHFVALVDVAIEMLCECGLDVETARKILLPLIGSTYGNLQQKTTHDALTGPFARGDAEAFERHLGALKESSTDVRAIYLALAARSVELMLRRDPHSDSFAELAELIRIAKEKLEC